MEKTFTEKVHCRVIFEFDYSCCNMYEEQLHENADDLHDWVLDYITDNVAEIMPKIKLTNLQIIEE